MDIDGSIQYWKINKTDILDTAKLEKEYVQCLLEWKTSKQFCQDHI